MLPIRDETLTLTLTLTLALPRIPYPNPSIVNHGHREEATRRAPDPACLE